MVPMVNIRENLRLIDVSTHPVTPCRVYVSQNVIQCTNVYTPYAGDRILLS